MLVAESTTDVTYSAYSYAVLCTALDAADAFALSVADPDAMIAVNVDVNCIPEIRMSVGIT